jgi:hypothetical protein
MMKPWYMQAVILAPRAVSARLGKHVGDGGIVGRPGGWALGPNGGAAEERGKVDVGHEKPGSEQSPGPFASSQLQETVLS